MYVSLAPAPTLLGFDFPIGFPRTYAERAGIENFVSWFRQLDLASPFFQIANDISEVSFQRPFFFPKNILEKNPGIKAQVREALGLTAWSALRRTDRAYGSRGASSEMFWTIGPKAVGKATLAGWRDTICPALAEPGRRYAIWPYDGRLFDLLREFDAVIVETYPADAYRQIGLRMGTGGLAKTRQDHRRCDARRLLDWCDLHDVLPDHDLVDQIEDGFGFGKDGEDRFDAVVGLFAMIGTVRRGEPPLPDDPAVTQVEGWIFGQPV